MSSRPTIGILLDYEEQGSFSMRPHYALRRAYFDAVWQAGGVPLGLGYIAGAEAATLDAVSGLIIPGGFYPFPCTYYADEEEARPVQVVEGAGQRQEKAKQLHPRHAAEMPLLAAALDRDFPVLGICAGMQVIAAHAGAGLFSDIKTQVDCGVDHLNERPAEEAAHAVIVTPGTKLREIVGVDDFMVNTAHNEAPRPDAIPDALIVSAVAPDGIIEAIERRDMRFCIGVQWHPEFFQRPGDPNLKLFEALVFAAARGEEKK